MNQIETIILLFAFLSVSIVGAAYLGPTALMVLTACLIVLINVALAKSIIVFQERIPLGILPFGFVYLIGNVAVELGGKKKGLSVALVSTLTQLFTMCFLKIVQQFPETGDGKAEQAIAELFDSTPRITLAGLLANFGIISEVLLYNYLQSLGKKSMKAQRTRFWRVISSASISAGVGQGVNTFIFVSIGFWKTNYNLLHLAFIIWFIKALVGILGAPLIPLCYWIATPASTPGRRQIS